MNPLVKHFGRLGLGCAGARHARWVVISLLSAHAALLAYGASVHSPTFNEPGHLVAGISHWKFGRFELYRVNPPLVRMVAALPVMAAGYEEDWSRFYEGPGARPEFSMGEDLVAANGERSFWLFTIARWACIPLSLLGGAICYLWGRDLLGPAAGVFTCALWSFSPNILGHAQLITPDAHAASLGLAACYVFWRRLRSPTWTQAAYASLALGAAEMAKSTLIIFYPLWPLLWVAYRWPTCGVGRISNPSSTTDGLKIGPTGQTWIREAGMLALMVVVSLYVLNLGYGFDGFFQRLDTLHFVSAQFAGTDDGADRGGNRFAGSWLGALRLPLPKNYLLGFDIQQRDFEGRSGPSYLGGEFRSGDWWYYYLYALTVKVPLGIWLLALLIVADRLFAAKRERPAGAPLDRRLSWRDELVLLAPAAVIFIVVSSETGFSHHMRYVLPSFPFAMVWLGQAATISRRSLRVLAVIALLWFITSSLYVYPHSLSYFNALAGGPARGHAHLIHSNIDWGQDLLYLKRWMDAHPEARPLYLAYHGYFDLAKVGFAETLPVQPRPAEAQKSAGTDANTTYPPGWYAISVNLLRGTSSPARDGQAQAPVADSNALTAFLLREPVARAGYSIYIYRVQE